MYKCYIVSDGIMGLLNGKYVLFATEQDYKEAYIASLILETN